MRLASFLRLGFPLAAALGIVVACTDQQQPQYASVPDDPVADEEPTEEAPAKPRKRKDAAVAEDAAEVEEPASPPRDAAPAVDSGITGKCASKFGNKLTEAFGRIDGIVYAVQKPSDTQCVLPNDDHVILQVLMNGAVYRMVVNVESDRPGTDQRVRFASLPHALPAPAFAEGWHTGVDLDYPSMLGAHVDAFTPYALPDLVNKIASAVKIGQPVSVYGTSEDFPESAHLVHRNTGGRPDGAIVIDPTTSPKFLLFHFSTTPSF